MDEMPLKRALRLTRALFETPTTPEATHEAIRRILSDLAVRQTVATMRASENFSGTRVQEHD
jgi:hypothetical protein